MPVCALSLSLSLSVVPLPSLSTHPLALPLRLAIILSSLFPPWNLSTSGQPHLPGCPQDINRTQRLVSVYPRPFTHYRADPLRSAPCRAARAAHTSARILCAVISFDIPIEVRSAREIRPGSYATPSCNAIWRPSTTDVK